MMKKCALYGRVSTAEQNVETQLCDLRKLAAQRGYEVIASSSGGNLWTSIMPGTSLREISPTSWASATAPSVLASEGERKTPSARALGGYAYKELTVAVSVSGKRMFVAHSTGLNGGMPDGSSKQPKGGNSRTCCPARRSRMFMRNRSVS